MFAHIVPGIRTSVVANLRPLSLLFMLPLPRLAAGLVTAILNALLCALAAWLMPGVTVHVIAAAVVGSTLFAIVVGVIMLVTD
jgi:uncharacterized membrane protein YvlD (DUF360 family)